MIGGIPDPAPIFQLISLRNDACKYRGAFAGVGCKSSSQNPMLSSNWK